MLYIFVILIMGVLERKKKTGKTAGSEDRVK
jgi:hypothetical protein